MRALKDFLYNKQFKKIRQEKKTFLKAEKNVIESLTILTDAQHYDMSQLNAAIVHFTKMGLDCDGFLVNALTNESDNERMELITPKDCNWYNVPSQEVLVKWLQHKTSLLIVINPSNHPTVKYLNATSNCLLKSAVVFGERELEGVNFALQVDSGDSKSLKDLCNTLYKELININKQG